MEIKLDQKFAGTCANLDFDEADNTFRIISVSAAPDAEAALVFRMPVSLDGADEKLIAERLAGTKTPDCFGLLEQLKSHVVGRCQSLGMALRVERLFEADINLFYELATDGRIDMRTGEVIK